MSWEEELKEFERLAQSALPGDAEAYGHNLEEDNGDSDNITELEEQEVNLQTLGEQIPELEDKRLRDDEEDANDSMYN